MINYQKEILNQLKMIHGRLALIQAHIERDVVDVEDIVQNPEMKKLIQDVKKLQLDNCFA